jgi:hypothetical protein
MEHIICSNIAKHLETHDILNDAQQWFRKKRSCESQLLLKIQDLAKGIDRDEQIDLSCLTFRRHLIMPQQETTLQSSVLWHQRVDSSVY